MPADSQRQRLREAQLASRRAARLRRIIIVGSAVLGVVLVAVMAVVLLQQGRQPDASTGASASASASGDVPYPPNATAARDGIVVVANSDVPVVGVYSDYQCSSCLRFEQSFGTALNLLAQTKEIQLVHHTRVFLDKGDANGLSHQAALGAACADVVGAHSAFDGAIWEAAKDGPYTDKLLQETIPAKVGITGADLTAFRSCYANRNLAPFVQQVEDLALKAGFTEAPVVTVNGKRIPNESFVGKTGEDLAKLIEDAAKA